MKYVHENDEQYWTFNDILNSFFSLLIEKSSNSFKHHFDSLQTKSLKFHRIWLMFFLHPYPYSKALYITFYLHSYP